MSSREIFAASHSSLKDRYWPLIKSRQTFLLALTGVAGYLSGQPFPLNWGRFACMLGSFLLTIGGCTSLNMVADRDIDFKMERTRGRPLPAGEVHAGVAAGLGLVLMAAGLAGALALSRLFLTLALLGILLNLGVYTLWLKRRSAWSILWGGMAGGIPVLAGRSLATGQIDTTGLLLGLAIFCWIPSHNLTLSVLHAEDFLEAGVPTFPAAYGSQATRAIVTLSSLASLGLMTAAFIQLGPSRLVVTGLALCGVGLVGLMTHPRGWASPKSVLVLYKYSSIFMLAAMLLLAWTAFS
jgi:protoheme IX farnesyltransferase